MVFSGRGDEPHAATVSTGSSWVFTFGRDCNGELGRPPVAGALDATGIPAAGHPAAGGAQDAASPTPSVVEPETDPVKAQLMGDPRCVTQLSNLPNGIVSVGSGFYHSAAVSSAGELYTWGAGSGGQLGRTRGSSSKSVGVCAAPALVPSLQSKQEHVLRVVGGRNHTVAICAPGRGFTWGRNMHGQLGHPPFPGATRRAEAHVLEPRHLRSLDARGRLADVSCGEYITAALTQQGEVLTWGRTANGRSGTGRLVAALTEPYALPRRAFGGVAVSSLALGWCVPLGIGHWHNWCIGALVHWRILAWCIATGVTAWRAHARGCSTRGAAARWASWGSRSAATGTRRS
jgi:alpha-tubulin suppressor-like RCC1 family protein